MGRKQKHTDTDIIAAHARLLELEPTIENRTKIAKELGFNWVGLYRRFRALGLPVRRVDTKGKNLLYPAEQIKLAHQALIDGKSVEEAGALIGATRGVMHYLIKKWNLKIPDKKIRYAKRRNDLYQISESAIKSAAAQIESGKQIDDVAQNVGIPPNFLRAKFKEIGLNPYRWIARLTKEQYIQAHADAMAGTRWKDIEAKYEIRASALIGMFHRLNLPELPARVSGPRYADEKTVHESHARLIAGNTYDEELKITGLTRSQLHQHFYKFGLIPPRKAQKNKRNPIKPNERWRFSVSKQTVREAYERFKAGATLTEIGKEWDKPYTSVSNAFARLGLEKIEKSLCAPETAKAAFDHIQKGGSIREAAGILQCSPLVVRDRLARHGYLIPLMRPLKLAAKKIE